ncbi:MAG: hypothetical protein HY077_14735 [Elusimicrobia bacterium]|nr:hypothetical protein [Elusimicrobiota bacterium]
MERTYRWAGLAVLAVTGCLYLGYSSPGASDAPQAEERAVTGFNVDAVSSERSSVPGPLRDAVAAARPVPAAVAARSAVSGAERVEGRSLFVELMSKPVDFIVKKTLLAKSESFEKFVRDPARVDRYLSHPLIRGVLDNPRLLRGLLSSQAVISGFVRSPAMQDSRAISALANSLLLKRISQDRGVQNVLKEPGFVSGLVLNPEAFGWLSKHPDALTAFSKMSPSVGQSMGGVGLIRR